MNTTFRNLAPQNPERVGYGPQMVGGSYSPQIVGAGPMARQRRAQGRGTYPGHGGYAPQGRHVQAGARQHPLPGGGMLVERPPTAKQVVFLGFGPQSINASATFVFSSQPQRIFRGERLTIPSSLANNFSINDLKVGTDSMNVGSGPIPAAVFSELGMLVALEIETASPGILILLSISNLSAGPQSFFSGLLGTSVT